MTNTKTTDREWGVCALGIIGLRRADDERGTLETRPLRFEPMRQDAGNVRTVRNLDGTTTTVREAWYGIVC